MSGSTMILRDLAVAAAGHPRIEQAVSAAIRQELPGVIESILRDQFPGETVRIYVAKRSTTSRRDRDIAIRAKYTGHNVKALSSEFGITPRMVFNIISGVKR